MLNICCSNREKIGRCWNTNSILDIGK